MREKDTAPGDGARGGVSKTVFVYEEYGWSPDDGVDHIGAGARGTVGRMWAWEVEGGMKWEGSTRYGSRSTRCLLSDYSWIVRRRGDEMLE